MENEYRPLQPLSHGNVLIIGMKASNLDIELRNHPRVIMWDSQNENWIRKEMPDNIRVVFMTRFISHATSTRILAEARKRKITIFNPDGTGTITRQVKELLTLTSTNQETTVKEEITTPNNTHSDEVKSHGKLKQLIPFIDWSKNNIENARNLMEGKCKELGITSTLQSLAQFVTVQRKKTHHTAVPKSIQSKVDVSVEILDNMIKELTDMREFLIATVDENRTLRAKMEKLQEIDGPVMTQREAIDILEQIFGRELSDQDFKDCTGNVGTCPVGECMLCSVRDCPGNEPLHYHHDGCPYCYQAEVKHYYSQGN